jgi:polyisoprenyl-phosphate glycosyltransferase
MSKTLISIVCGCRNEEGNLPELYERINSVFSALPAFDFELIIADNDSRDSSREVIRNLCRSDVRVKAIFNTRNFGPERSGGNAILQAQGRAVICVASDLQTPPEVIPQFIKHWQEGFRIVAAIRKGSEEGFVMRKLRVLYYGLVQSMSHTRPLKHFTGFGLYDRTVIEEIRKVADPDPFFRGIIAEFGFPVYCVDYIQPKRRRGKTSYNWYRLLDHGILGLFSQTRVPLRLATLLGFVTAVIAFLVGAVYFILKLFYWKSFSIGIAPVIIGLFFFASVQLIFVGILGEYIGAIYTKVANKPLVVEEERINF